MTREKLINMLRSKHRLFNSADVNGASKKRIKLHMQQLATTIARDVLCSEQVK